MSKPTMAYRAEVPATENGGILSIEIYDFIDSFGGPWGVSAREVVDAIGARDDYEKIQVRINSGGGDLFEAYAIYNRLKAHFAPVEVYIDGLAASAASVIAMAGDVINMAENAWLMVHEPWTGAVGNASDMREQAELLDRNTEMLIGIYAERSGAQPEVVRDWITAETWFTGPEALTAGLVDQVTQPNKIAASAAIRSFNTAPAAAVRALTNKPKQEPKAMDTPSPASLTDLKNACPGADSDFLLENAEKGATLAQAQAAWINTLTARLENRDSQIQELGEKHEEEIEGLKVEHTAQVLALTEAKEAAETKLANVQAGINPSDSPVADDADSQKKARSASAFAQAVKLHRN